MVLLKPPAGLLLTPGAGADRDHPTLVAIEQALSGEGAIPVRRVTLGTTSVPRAVAKVVDATNEFADELGVSTANLVIGGRSFGGRSCSVAAAEGLDVGGLLLLSYPLHPPGRPEKLRVDHFANISVPTVFVSGVKDPFGTPEEFDEHVGAVAGPTEMHWVNGGHSPKGAQEAAVVDYVAAALS